MFNLNVVNGKIAGFYDENQIYIGRKCKQHSASVLANPYLINRDGTREEVLEKYRRWLWEEFKKNGVVKLELERIVSLVKQGKNIELVCWCHPAQCHGDIIKKCIAWMLESYRVNPSPKLTIELVPSTCWYSNVRSNVSKQDWDILRKNTYKSANYRCEICGGVGKTHPVECHEIWHYDDSLHIQRLDGLIALCPSCHQVKHMGLATINGKQEEAIQHLAKVNNWSLTDAIEYSEASFEIWSQRSKYDWKLDISYLERLKV